MVLEPPLSMFIHPVQFKFSSKPPDVLSAMRAVVVDKGLDDMATKPCMSCSR
jgi:hypothetical protein